MNILTQEARKRQAVVKLARRKEGSLAVRMYGVSLPSVKRWNKRCDGKDWHSLLERSHRPHSHPRQHTEAEEMILFKALALKPTQGDTKRFFLQKWFISIDITKMQVFFVKIRLATSGKMWYNLSVV